MIEWLLFKTYAIAQVQQFNERYLNNKESAASSDSAAESEDDTEEEVHTFPSFLQRKVDPSVMPPSELCFAVYQDRTNLCLQNTYLLLNQMIVLGPSNAVSERQVKAMNVIKTVQRSALGQAKLNNQ